MGWLVFILLLILILFGISSGMQSYASAQQAQATIEVAQVAQTQAWTNMISILVLAALIILIVFALVALIILAIRFLQVRAETRPLKLHQPQHSPHLAKSSSSALLLQNGPKITEFEELTPEEIEFVQRLLER